MSRRYGQIVSAIWNDPGFRALPGHAQRVYLMLVTQANISSAGTLELTIKRWAGYAIDTLSDSLSDSLSTLAAHRFIVVDIDTEEVLVRKFVKWDGGYTNGKRLPSIIAAGEAISSPEIRAVLAQELTDLGLENRLSDSHPDRASDSPRDVVTEVVQIPQPTTPEPQPPNPTTPVETQSDQLRNATSRATLKPINDADAAALDEARKRANADAVIDQDRRAPLNPAAAKAARALVIANLAQRGKTPPPPPPADTCTVCGKPADSDEPDRCTMHRHTTPIEELTP